MDESHAGFNSHLNAVLERRQTRLREIGERLEKRARLPGRELAARAASATAPTRMHLARLLVEGGHARDTQEAFDRWLNRDKAGHVPAEWPAFAAAMCVLRDSAAIPVLAHPHRYRLSAGGLRELTAAFVQEGGAALEASMAGMSPNDADRIASLCRRFNLLASMGSDFHDPAVPWNPLGRWLKLAAGLEPVTHLSPRDCSQPMSEIEDQDNVDRELFKNVEKLRELRIAHRDLDEVISRLSLDFQSDQLQLKRLKKRKLILKDQITRLESELIPDLNA